MRVGPRVAGVELDRTGYALEHAPGGLGEELAEACRIMPRALKRSLCNRSLEQMLEGYSMVPVHGPSSFPAIGQSTSPISYAAGAVQVSPCPLQWTLYYSR